MRVIRVTGFSGEPDGLERIGSLGPVLACLLADNGFSTASSPFGTQSVLHGLIAFNHSPRALREVETLGVARERRLLTLWEPSIVDPVAHAAHTLRHYGQVIAPSPLWPHTSANHVVSWPQNLAPEPPEPLEIWARRGSTPVMMQRNLFSAVKGERYSLRRRVLDRARRDGLDLRLYGADWAHGPMWGPLLWSVSARRAVRARRIPRLRGLRCARPALVDYWGFAPTYDEVYRHHRIVLCIENSPDYVSEKLFMAISRQALPVYVGPADLLPSDLDMEGLIADPVPDAIIARLREQIERPVEEQYAHALRLRSASVTAPEIMSPDAVAETIADIAVEAFRDD